MVYMEWLDNAKHARKPPGVFVGSPVVSAIPNNKWPPFSPEFEFTLAKDFFQEDEAKEQPKAPEVKAAEPKAAPVETTKASTKKDLSGSEFYMMINDENHGLSSYSSNNSCIPNLNPESVVLARDKKLLQSCSALTVCNSSPRHIDWWHDKALI